MNFIAIIMTPSIVFRQKFRKTCSQKLLSRIDSNSPYFCLCDFAEWKWNVRCKQCFDGSTYELNDCSIH